MAKSNKGRKFFATTATAALVASAIVPVASAAQINDFNSISSYAQEAVQDLNDRGVIKGDQKGNFNPKSAITRAEAATILAGALELEGSGSTSFTDVKKSAWYYDAIDAAVANGIFQGQGAGKFNPSANLTRSEAAIILVDAFGLEGSADLKEFKDSASVKSWAEEALSIAVANGVMKGDDNGNLKPNASITRQDFALMYYRTEGVEGTEEVSGSVKAINATTVEVTFAEEVADVKALDFAIKGLEVSNAVVKQTDKKTVVLTTSAQTAGVEYTVTVNGEEFGKFTGISAVVPTKVELVSPSVQGKLGQQVTVQAKVTVAEGASKAGIPVTLFVPGSADGIKAAVTVEAVTDANGVATHTYTRYAATTDAVTVYATGDRSKFTTGYVFWGVDTILAIAEVTEGATVNNGSNKTYKVTYKNATTGLVEANKTLNVSFVENINVTADKVKNATVNGVNVQQLSNGTVVKAAQITTDSKGEATFTVSGTNTEVTPVVYEAAPIYVSSNSSSISGYSQKFEASNLQATASKVKFAAVQAEYTIELTRDGGEVAAIGYQNGRKYNVVVKDKAGKLAANEVVNVAFNEDIDRVISTVTDAEFIKFNDDGDKIGYRGDKITVKTNSKGEASFYIGNSKENTYATPVAWIDINSSNAKDGQLDEGEPTTVGAISYFQNEYVDGAGIKVTDTAGKKKSDFDGEGPAVFKVNLTNQSGEEYTLSRSGEEIKSVSYTVFNTGSNDVYVFDKGNKQLISPNRSYTLTNFGTGDLNVYSEEGKTTSVKVVATGVARYYDEDLKAFKDFNFNAKEATAKFIATGDISNPYTGVIDLASIDKDKKEIKFTGKKAIKYAGESGKTYKYYGIGSTPITTAANFIEELEGYAGQTVRVTYEVKDDVVSFYIVSVSGGSADVTSKVNSATTLAQVKAALASNASYAKLSAAAKDTAASDIFTAVQTGTVYTPASLEAKVASYIVIDLTSAVYTAGTTGAAGAKATGVYANATTPANTLTIESAAGATQYNGLKVVFEKDTVTGTAVTTAYDSTNKVLTVKLPVTVDAISGESTINTTAATFAAVETAIEAFNSASPLVVTLATLSGDASELEGKEITLSGATETTTTVAGKLVLTFSEAITAFTGLTATGTTALTIGTGATDSTAAISADGKVVTITLGSAATVVAGNTITGVTITPAVTGQANSVSVTNATTITTP